MKKGNWLALSGVMAAVFAFQSGAAQAQGAPEPAAPAAGSAESDVIIITAEKRSENLETVPLAVSAFSAKDREKLGIKTVQDLTNVTPGVAYSVGLDRFYVRGIGRTSNGGGTDGGTAIYHDDVFTESSYTAAIPNIFYPTIQVLRGPQVTLYGRNAIGGALLINEKRPDHLQTEEFRAAYGAFEKWEVGTRISGPMPGTDKIRYSLAADYWDQGDGWLKNVNGGKNEGNTGTFGFYGVQFDADITPNLNAWLNIENITFDYSNRNTGISSAPWVDAFAQTAISYYPNAQWAARSGQALNVVTMGPAETENAGFATGDRYSFVGDTFTRQTLRNNYSVTGHVSWDIGDTNLKYIGGANNYYYNLYLDNDGTNVSSFTVPVTTNPTCTLPAPAIQCATISGQTVGGYIEDRKWWTHELDWSSTGDGPVQWLGGLFYYNEDEANPQYADNPGAGLQSAALRAPLSAPANPSGHQYWYNQIVHSTSAAVFGQVDWDITDQLSATLGLRYTHDEKKMREELRVLCYGAGTWLTFCPSLQTLGTLTPATDITVVQLFSSGVLSNLYPGVLTVAHPDPTGNGNYIRDLGDSWNDTTGSFSLNWKPNESTLLYGRYDRGYKAGAFTNALNIVAFPEADKENVDAYEIGAKFRPLERVQTNVAMFFYDWKNRQTPITIPAGTGINTGSTPASFYINLPKSVSKGLELETTWTPITDAHVRFSYAYLDARIDDHGTYVDSSVPGSAPQDLNDAELPNSPMNRYSFGGDYTFRPNIGPINVAASYAWREHSYADIFNTAWRYTPSYGNLNLTGSWTDSSGRFSIFAFVNNATNEKSYQYVTQAGQFVPGTGTAAVGAAYQTTSVTSTFQASTYNANPLRTWGVELRAKF
jgi:iron complex outermembrane receptor protein